MKIIVLVFVLLNILLGNNIKKGDILFNMHNRFYEPVFLSYGLSDNLEIIFLSPGIRYNIYKTLDIQTSVTAQLYGSGGVNETTTKVDSNGNYSENSLDVTYQLYRFEIDSSLNTENLNFIRFVNVTINHYLAYSSEINDKYLDRFSFGFFNTFQKNFKWGFLFIHEKENNICNETTGPTSYNCSFNRNYMNGLVGYKKNRYEINFSLNNRQEEKEDLIHIKYYPSWKYEFSAKYIF